MAGDALFEDIAAYLDARVAAGTAPVRHPAAIPVVLSATRMKRAAQRKTA